MIAAFKPTGYQASWHDEHTPFKYCGRRCQLMKGRQSILVIEDNPTTAKTLSLFLQSEGYQVEWADTGVDGLERFREDGFDLVLLDIMLPDLDGIAVCRDIRIGSTVPIVMLTARTTEDEIVEGLEAGADDYVCKPFGSRELLARIRRCLRGPSMPEATCGRIAVGDILIDVEKRSVLMKDRQIRLTKSEFEILVLLARNPGRVFTRDQLIERALGPDFDGFDRTIDTHIWSLRKKLGEPRGQPVYIQSELGVGYRMREQHAA
ncbi:MAG: response regulator transcription factor [Blastomonas sp.]